MFELPDAYVAIRSEADEIAASIADIAGDADESSTVDSRVRSVLAQSRLAQLVVPKAYGGRFEQIDPLAVTVAREGLNAVSGHLDSLFSLQGIGSYALTVAGSEDQKQAWLPRVATMEALAALALTEDVAGSDLKAMQTIVRPDGGILRLNGEKTWISNAGAADFYSVLAREEAGFSLMLVPADAPGITIQPTPEIMAPHVLGSVRFDDVELDSGDRIGPPGRGFDFVLATLAVFRVSVAGAALGLAETALREATRHANQRHQFGRPLSRLGPVAALLADSWTDLEQSRLLTYRAAARARCNPRASLHHSSMAKLSATEAASRIADRCVQVMGRWGLVRGSVVERAYRAARPMRVYEGATEVLKLGIAQGLHEELG